MSESNGTPKPPPPIAFELRRPGEPMEVITMTPIEGGLRLHEGQWWICGMAKGDVFKSIRLLDIVMFFGTPMERSVRDRCLCGALDGADCGCLAGASGGPRP